MVKIGAEVQVGDRLDLPVNRLAGAGPLVVESLDRVGVVYDDEVSLRVRWEDGSKTLLLLERDGLVQTV